MAGTVLILSPGLWLLRDEVASLTGLKPVRGLGLMPRCDAIAGWGHKPTAERARRIAAQKKLPYIAIEDGFLRSVKPGNDMRPLALVMDRIGIYYDAREPSDLEALINAGPVSVTELALAEQAMTLIRERKLSKYNSAPTWSGIAARDYFLVIDQTVGDASISGGLAGASTFEKMVKHALEDAQGRPVIVKLHPETAMGRKAGFLSRFIGNKDVSVVSEQCNPWDLLGHAQRIYTVSSQLGFEALMAGHEVHCFGAPFYAGWGLTQDHLVLPARKRKATVAELFAAAYLRYSHYFDAWTRARCDVLTAVDQLSFLRDRYVENDRPVIFYRMPRWKRKPIARLLAGPSGAARYSGDLEAAILGARKSGGAVAAWGRTANAIRARMTAENVPLISVEDGFIRSAGLGAAFMPSLSFSFDRKGIYYDPGIPSDLEDLLQNLDVDARVVERAKALRLRLIAENVSKYNLKGNSLPALPKDRRRILVAGQVADDEAVLKSLSGAAPNINLMMLQEVRRQFPDAFVIYKPHPDVERLGRAGRVSDEDASGLADAVFSKVAIGDALDAADEVAVFTSLAGFEALVRGKRVRVFGRPFYAGWGLTQDIEAIPGRTRQRSLDELLAITLLVYPLYYDPVSGLPCRAETTIDRLSEMRNRPPQVVDLWRIPVARAVLLCRRFLR